MASEPAADTSYVATRHPRYMLHVPSGWLWDTWTASFVDSESLELLEPQAAGGAPLTNETMKLVVEASSVLAPGSVVLVDASGLSVGRDSHPFERRLRLPELAVSRFHASLFVQTSDPSDGPSAEPGLPQRTFCVADPGSTHGTFLNDERLSDPKVASKPKPLAHGDRLRIGSTVLKAHIHKRWSCSEAAELSRLRLEPLGDERGGDRPRAKTKQPSKTQAFRKSDGKVSKR
ncbi:hypothetical protein HK105_204784 [Polyrhizophydium stewartii]|uniref:FHA domain-containing protein n=1 Tax=Polyrhizophydium stewartii TaxID=2732419 RepID=A0ABR4N824_9FUNG